MDYLPSIIVGLSLLTVIVLILARGGAVLWRWLFAVEVIFLFECLGNCLVPGSWRQFWEIEIPALLIAGGLAVGSSIMRCRKERRSGIVAVGATPQMISFYGVLAIVAIIVASH